MRSRRRSVCMQCRGVCSRTTEGIGSCSRRTWTRERRPTEALPGETLVVNTLSSTNKELDSVGAQEKILQAKVSTALAARIAAVSSLENATKDLESAQDELKALKSIKTWLIKRKSEAISADEELWRFTMHPLPLLDSSTESEKSALDNNIPEISANHAENPANKRLKSADGIFVSLTLKNSVLNNVFGRSDKDPLELVAKFPVSKDIGDVYGTECSWTKLPELKEIFTSANQAGVSMKKIAQKKGWDGRTFTLNMRTAMSVVGKFTLDANGARHWISAAEVPDRITTGEEPGPH